MEMMKVALFFPNQISAVFRYQVKLLYILQDIVEIKVKGYQWD